MVLHIDKILESEKKIELMVRKEIKQDDQVYLNIILGIY